MAGEKMEAEKMSSRMDAIETEIQELSTVSKNMVKVLFSLRIDVNRRLCSMERGVEKMEAEDMSSTGMDAIEEEILWLSSMERGLQKMEAENMSSRMDAIEKEIQRLSSMAKRLVNLLLSLRMDVNRRLSSMERGVEDMEAKKMSSRMDAIEEEFLRISSMDKGMIKLPFSWRMGPMERSVQKMEAEKMSSRLDAIEKETQQLSSMDKCMIRLLFSLRTDVNRRLSSIERGAEKMSSRTTGAIEEEIDRLFSMDMGMIQPPFSPRRDVTRRLSSTMERGVEAEKKKSPRVDAAIEKRTQSLSSMETAEQKMSTRTTGPIEEEIQLRRLSPMDTGMNRLPFSSRMDVTRRLSSMERGVEKMSSKLDEIEEVVQLLTSMEMRILRRVISLGTDLSRRLSSIERGVQLLLQEKNGD